MHLWHILNLCSPRLYLGAFISNLTAILSLAMYPVVNNDSTVFPIFSCICIYAFLTSFQYASISVLMDKQPSLNLSDHLPKVIDSLIF